MSAFPEFNFGIAGDGQVLHAPVNVYAKDTRKHIHKLTQNRNTDN